MKSVNTFFTPWDVLSEDFPNRPIWMPSPDRIVECVCVRDAHILYERASSRNTGHAARR